MPRRFPFHAPDPAYEGLIQAQFPEAEEIDLYLERVSEAVVQTSGLTRKEILFGQCTCVDDVIYSKSELENQGFLGPFNLGGLAGLPFAGKTGAAAFASHVPEGGAIFVLCAPHIGITRQGKWGSINRFRQEGGSPCCGAVYQALAATEQPAIPPLEEDDFQQSSLDRLAWTHRNHLQGGDRLQIFTGLIYRNAARKLIRYMREARVPCRRIYFAGGIIINTDQAYHDSFHQIHLLEIDVPTWKIRRLSAPALPGLQA